MKKDNFPAARKLLDTPKDTLIANVPFRDLLIATGIVALVKILADLRGPPRPCRHPIYAVGKKKSYCLICNNVLSLELPRKVRKKPKQS